MLSLAETASVEFVIRNSRFLAEAIITSSQEEARAELRLRKELHSDASHVVHAFIVGGNGEILGCSDDGEPSGTAEPSLEPADSSRRIQSLQKRCWVRLLPFPSC